MEKEFTLGIRFEESAVAAQRFVTLYFDEQAITTWSIALCMVKAGVIDRALIVGTGTPAKLELSLVRHSRRGQRATSSRVRGVLAVAISETELDFWIDFFLKYLRDGHGSVDHLDVETFADDTHSRTLDLILRVPFATPAVSPTEARRRLGL